MQTRPTDLGAHEGIDVEHRSRRRERHAPVDHGAHSRFATVLVEGPRWLLLAVLLYAPWAYGCTRVWTIDVLNLALFVILGCWLTKCLITRHRSHVPLVLRLAVGWLLLQGWWMVFNAGFSYDEAYVPHARPNLLPDAPGAVDYDAAWPTMLGLTAMLGLVCFACEMTVDRQWRRRVWITMALAGTSMIVLGLAQKISGAPGIFWQSEGHAPTFFGTFRYHANAGSFINLVWPLAAAMLVRSVRREEARWRQLAWSACLILGLGGAMANTSRASGLITVLWLLGWAIWLVAQVVRRRSDGGNPAAVVGVGLALAAVVISLLAAGGLDSTLRRWQEFDREMTSANSRLMVAGVCLDMLPQSGWLGFGPGTFKTAFPFFNFDRSFATEGVWLFAHQDYLQTLVEWGWIGAAFWAVVLGGGLVAAGLLLFRGRLDDHDRAWPIAAGAAVLAVLTHAMVDFPLQIASIQLYVVVLVGLLWSTRYWADADDLRTSEPRVRRRRTLRSHRSILPSDEREVSA